MAVEGVEAMAVAVKVAVVEVKVDVVIPVLIAVLVDVMALAGGDAKQHVKVVAKALR